MSASIAVWGLLAVISGIFICAYGYSLFRAVLAGAGFIVGLWLAARFTVGQDDLIRLLVSLLLGGGLAVVLYSLHRLGLYIAGALGGVIIGFMVVGILNITEGTGTLVLVVVTAIIGAVLARAAGELAVIAGTSLLGGYAVLYGLSILFPGVLSATSDSATITMTPFNTALLVVIVLVAVFGQLDTRRQRRRGIL